MYFLRDFVGLSALILRLSVALRTILKSWGEYRNCQNLGVSNTTVCRSTMDSHIPAQWTATYIREIIFLLGGPLQCVSQIAHCADSCLWLRGANILLHLVLSVLQPR